MLKEHYFDPNYQYTSKILKNYLKTQEGFKKKICMDMPSGNGRNIFLLALHFEHVYGVDISQKYLDEIENYKSVYQVFNITTSILDVTKNTPITLSSADFICISHFYDFTFLHKVKLSIKVGAKIYVETPSCRGGNYFELPSKTELEAFLSGFKIIFYKNNVCNSDNRLNKSISFTAILEKKINGSK